MLLGGITMPKKQLTKKICKEILLDEPGASKLYHDLGYHKQGRQEAQHYGFFKKECKKAK
jgi:hypothetical protein